MVWTQMQDFLFFTFSLGSYSRVALVIWKLSHRLCLTNLKPKTKYLVFLLGFVILKKKSHLHSQTGETWSFHGQKALNGRQGARGNAECSEFCTICWPWHCRVVCCCFIFHMKHENKDQGYQQLWRFQKPGKFSSIFAALWWEHLHCTNHSSANKLNIYSTHLQNSGTMLPVWQHGSDLPI